MRKALVVSAVALGVAVVTATPALADSATTPVALDCYVLTVGQSSNPIVVTVCPPV